MSHSQAWPPQNHVPPTSSFNKDKQWPCNPLLSPRCDAGQPGWGGPQDGHHPRLAAGWRWPTAGRRAPQEGTSGTAPYAAPSLGGPWILCAPHRSPPMEGWLAQERMLRSPSPAACLSSSLRSSRSTSHWRSGLKPGSLHKSSHTTEVVWDLPGLGGLWEASGSMGGRDKSVIKDSVHRQQLYSDHSSGPLQV